MLDTDDLFQELSISGGSATIEISSKDDSSGRYWITKVTAKLVCSNILLTEPCVVLVRLRDGQYIIGTDDIPAKPTIKEGVITEMELEYRSVTMPIPIKKVLYFGAQEL